MQARARSGRRRTRTLVSVGCAAALALGASPALAGSSIPGPNEIRSSENMSLLSNTPKTAPLDATNSDLAFQGGMAFQGNYNGFRIWDITKNKPRLVSEVLCPGSQNDISVSGNLLFLATDSRRSNDSCENLPAPTEPVDYWEGIKIFDISDPVRPKYVSSVETDCGSHTLTINPQGKNKVWVYVSSYDISTVATKCQAPHDKISIVQVDRRSPQDAAVVAEPILFPDGGNPGDPVDTPPLDRTRATAGCHDITVFPSKKLAAGACMGDGVLWDLSNPAVFREIDRVQDDANFAFWHSATFNNDGTKVVFTDELGGGGAATCVASIPNTRGADGIYDIEGAGLNRELVFKSYYKIPRINADTENCVAHNGSLIPVPGKDIMVQSWYMGGISVWDFTDSANPVEIGFWERGPVPQDEAVDTSGGTWSAYWYNGRIYSSDIGKGFDVLKITGQQFNQANKVKYSELNVQTQPVYAER